MAMKNENIQLGNPLQIITFRRENKGLVLQGASPWQKGNHIYVTVAPRNMDRRKAVRVYKKNVINTSFAEDLVQVDTALQGNPRPYKKQMTIFDM